MAIFIGSTALNAIQMLRDGSSSSSEPSSLLDMSQQSASSSMNSNNTFTDLSISGTSTNGSMSTLTISNDRLRDLAVCAVILDEWLKELSAITHEQSVAMLNSEK